MNETFLFWGLAVVWSLIAGFVGWVLRRQAALRARVERLERSLGRSAGD